jgi:hypothetical protein
MASEKTVFSEIAVALGILGDNYPEMKSLGSIENVNSDAKAKFLQRLGKAGVDQNLNRSSQGLYEAGRLVRSFLEKRAGVRDPKVRWTGGGRTLALAPKDIEIIGSYKVSVKEESRLIRNPSPYNVFERWPKADFFSRRRSENWFLRIAEQSLQEYYGSCGGPQTTGCLTVRDFFANADSTNKNEFKKHVANLTKSDSTVHKIYQRFCSEVSTKSAQIFNESLDRSKISEISRYFFLINTNSYILAGLERGSPFAVLVPDLDDWTSRFEIKKVVAHPKEAGQPEVRISITLLNKHDRSEHIFNIRVEVRWSHGKFCGNPEAKVYREWEIQEIPGVVIP